MGVEEKRKALNDELTAHLRNLTFKQYSVAVKAFSALLEAFALAPGTKEDQLRGKAAGPPQQDTDQYGS